MNILNKKKYYFCGATGILFLYLFPYIFLGENSYILIHDNLDSNVVWFKVLAESGKIFDSSLTVIDSFMGGMPRISFGSEYNLILWMYYFFEPYTAYVINQFIIHIVAFLGMYILLNKYIFKEENEFIFSIVIALLFALLPFWPSGGLSVAGLPLITYVFLNFRNSQAEKKDWLFLVLVPFYSSLILSFMFFIVFAFCVWIFDAVIGKRNWHFFAALTVFGCLFLLVEYRLVLGMIESNGYVSHRIEMYPEYINFIQAVKTSVNHFLNGQYHAHSLHKIFIPIIGIVFLLQIKNKSYNQLFFIVLTVNIFVSFWYGFWDYEGWKSIKEYIPLLRGLNLSRFHFLSPLIWYILIAISVKYIYRYYGKKYNKYILSIIVVQIIYLFYSSDFICEYKTNRISYTSFYAKKQFLEIKNYINNIDKNYRVVSIGIHPAIAQYNNFQTLDGYSANYPLEYKHKFRKIIELELEKSDTLRNYFDKWGSRVYIFSSEIGNNFLNTKNQKNGVRINLMTDEMLKMKCRYILSSVPIKNLQINNLKLLKLFSNNNSAWDIFLYQIQPK